MVGSSLPPGFRFHPTDEELVGYYLQRRNEGLEIELEVIPVIDLYSFDPWELPEKSFLPNRDMEWFFFCLRDRKYPNGSRANRATRSGYWKATGKDRKVACESSSSSFPPVIGYRKTLVFYLGRAPLGGRTEWVMHEYRLCEDTSQASHNFKGAFALCRVSKRNAQTHKKGESSSTMAANEPLNSSDGVPCHPSYTQKQSSGSSPVASNLSEAGSSGIWASQEDFILESASMVYLQAEESASEQILQHEDLPSSTQFEYPEFLIDPSYSNFNWEMEESSDTSPNSEFYMNMDIMSYDSFDHFGWMNINSGTNTF